MQPKTNQDDGKLIATTYNEEKCREALARFVLLDEAPFKTVEGNGFKYMLSVFEPRFHVPCRTTIARDVLQVYVDEKKKLKDFFVRNQQRVCLTTDTWTSIQNINYMCLTAHFVDNNWKLQKKILNFCPISNHKGDTIGKALEACLKSWGIERVLTVTVDNASSNNDAILYLSKIVNSWNGAIMNGNHMHLRCSAHILNLIVTEGLKDYHESISKIRNVVRYVRGSPARLQKFKSCAEREKISSKKLLCLDVPTRWNSTYLMLESAEKFQKAFEMLEDHDTQYFRDFCLGEDKGAPTSLDWEYARCFIKFLKVFFHATLKFSGSLFVTFNTFLRHLCMVHSQLQNWCDSKDIFLKHMAENMKKKYDKYWGSYQVINPFLFIAVLLDPRHKQRLLRYCFALLWSEDKANEMTSRVINTLNELYYQYKVIYFANVEAIDNMPIANDMPADNDEIDADSLFNSSYMQLVNETDGVDNKTENPGAISYHFWTAKFGCCCRIQTLL
ncbi:hypothetical protein Dsin_028690 [Dipteronia sinensis]|uniref:hAT-like transposase RNase-H fold domain-containing protein n=1 Tax=Dipteronia sinensis TaxID=43782 RepID=A0AAE0DUV2_9ROSI|nr:hypothetical protein Dsin_028690 [Dipteronia sinensis]